MEARKSRVADAKMSREYLDARRNQDPEGLYHLSFVDRKGNDVDISGCTEDEASGLETVALVCVSVWVRVFVDKVGACSAFVPCPRSPLVVPTRLLCAICHCAVIQEQDRVH
jgi:hypothetical protein